MIEGEAEGDHLADGDFVFEYGWLRLDAVDAQDGAIGRIQDRGEGVSIHWPKTGDGGGAAGKIVQPQGAFDRAGYGFSRGDGRVIARVGKSSYEVGATKADPSG